MERSERKRSRTILRRSRSVAGAWSIIGKGAIPRIRSTSAWGLKNLLEHNGDRLAGAEAAVAVLGAHGIEDLDADADLARGVLVWGNQPEPGVGHAMAFNLNLRRQGPEVD